MKLPLLYLAGKAKLVVHSVTRGWCSAACFTLVRNGVNYLIVLVMAQIERVRRQLRNSEVAIRAIKQQSISSLALRFIRHHLLYSAIIS